MSSSGTTAINSGPLIIRTYLDGSGNNTYLMGLNDAPVYSNRILITSSNGLLAPSDNIYISSIVISSINGGPYIPGGGGGDAFWSSLNNNIYNKNTGGNVGIGTSTPQYTLDVYGSANFGGPVYFQSTISSVSISSILPDPGDYSLRLFGNVFFYSTLNAPPGSTLIVYASTSFNRPVVFNNSITVNQGNTLYIDAPTTFNEDVYFNSTINAPPGSTLVFNSPSLFYNLSTTNPLTVIGNDGGPTNIIQIGYISSFSTFNYVNSTIFNYEYTETVSLVSTDTLFITPPGNSNSQIVFQTQYGNSNVLSTPQNNVIIANNGNVGISTMTPQYNLDVNGSAGFAGPVSTNTINMSGGLITGVISIVSNPLDNNINIYGNVFFNSTINTIGASTLIFNPDCLIYNLSTTNITTTSISTISIYDNTGSTGSPNQVLTSVGGNIQWQNGSGGIPTSTIIYNQNIPTGLSAGSNPLGAPQTLNISGYYFISYQISSNITYNPGDSVTIGLGFYNSGLQYVIEGTSYTLPPISGQFTTSNLNLANIIYTGNYYLPAVTIVGSPTINAGMSLKVTAIYFAPSQ